MGLIIEDKDQFNKFINTFCNLIKVAPEYTGDLNSEDNEPLSNKEKQRLTNIATIVFEILKYFVNHQSRNHFEFLLEHAAFKELLIRMVYGREIEVEKLREDTNEILGKIATINNGEYV